MYTHLEEEETHTFLKISSFLLFNSNRSPSGGRNHLWEDDVKPQRSGDLFYPHPPPLYKLRMAQKDLRLSTLLPESTLTPGGAKK